MSDQPTTPPDEDDVPDEPEFPDSPADE